MFGPGVGGRWSIFELPGAMLLSLSAICLFDTEGPRGLSSDEQIHVVASPGKRPGGDLSWL